MKDLLTIVFIGFDGYSDLWDDCIGLFKHFWSNCPYKVLFVDNVKEVNWEGITSLHSGKDAEWSRKIQTAISNCNTPYICLLLEDFFVGDYIDNNIIKNTLQIIKDNNLSYYKLVNMSRAVKNKDPMFKNYSFLHVIPENDEYGVSLQAAIWDVNYLKKLVGDENYNAWKFEFARVKDAQDKPNIPKQGCVFDDRNILNLQHGVIQSKYLPNTIKYFKKKGITLNINRPVMSYFNYYKIRLISKGKYVLPRSWRQFVKKILEKCGMKFVSTIRDK